MKLKSLERLFLHELRHLHSAAMQHSRALPRMIKAADHSDLKDAFEEQLDQVRAQIGRLDEVFAGLDKSPEGDESLGMKGLAEEVEHLVEKDADQSVRDAGLIGTAQRMAHHAIASYGTARTHARLLGHETEHAHLSASLAETRAADEKLTQLAESAVNLDAAAASESRPR